MKSNTWQEFYAVSSNNQLQPGATGDVYLSIYPIDCTVFDTMASLAPLKISFEEKIIFSLICNFSTIGKGFLGVNAETYLSIKGFSRTRRTALVSL